MTPKRWLGFMLLCVLGASGWLIEEAWPSVLSDASREWLHNLMIAFAVGIVGCRNLVRSELGMRSWVKLALGSVCLFGIPAALIERARSGVSDGTIAALFALLPVAVVILIPYFQFGGRADSETTQMLAPALIGLAGTVLLLPFALPASLHEMGSFAVVVVAVLVAASASVWMYHLLAEVGVVEAVVACCVSNSIFLLAVSVASNGTDGPNWGGPWSWNAVCLGALKAACVDLPQIVLLLWLMREVSPVRLAARTLVVPMLTVLEGYVLLRPEIAVRSVCGAALLIYCAWRLLTGGQRDEGPGLMLR